MRKARIIPAPSTTGVLAPATDALVGRVVAILEAARARVVRSVNSEMVLAYWLIGREVVEEQQRGQDRAEYGQAVIERVAEALASRYGRGFSSRNVHYFRSFYLVFSDRRPEILQRSIAESAGSPVAMSDPYALAVAAPTIPGFSGDLSWGHYRALSAVEHRVERLFLEIEAVNARWTVADLERQIHTHLFLRLRKSRKAAGVADLAQRGEAIERPVDILRAPYVLDFLGLPDGEVLHETDLEAALIGQLQKFLLELGKGFAFVARQKRLDYDDECFYVDLVFYNCILKCYVLIDLKTGKLTHQDVGQMDSYVRLYDDKYTTTGDNPTIGLLLCAKKSAAVARYSVLHGSEQIFAARYVTWLPSVEELQAELERETLFVESRRAR